MEACDFRLWLPNAITPSKSDGLNDNITGMICDGAKPSCSLKVATGVSTAVLSSMLAIEDEVVSSAEGIIDDDVDRCVQNMASIGTRGMAATDSLVLDIMTRK